MIGRNLSVRNTAVNALAGSTTMTRIQSFKTLSFDLLCSKVLLLGELSLDSTIRSTFSITGLLVSVLKSSTHLVIVSKDAVVDPTGSSRMYSR